MISPQISAIIEKRLANTNPPQGGIRDVGVVLFALA